MPWSRSDERWEKVDMFNSGGGAGACEEMGIPFLGKIPIEPVIAEAGDSGKSFVSEHGGCPAAQSFEGIVKKVEDSVKGGKGRG